MPTTSEVLSPIKKIANSSFIGSPNSLPSPEATLKELKAFIIKNDLDVKCNTGGASRRTKSDIYRDLCRALEKKCKSVESPNVEESPKAMREPSERKASRISVITYNLNRWPLALIPLAILLFQFQHYAFIVFTETGSKKKCKKIAHAFAPTHDCIFDELRNNDHIILLWKREWALENNEYHCSFYGKYIHGKFRNITTGQQIDIFGVHLPWRKGRALALSLLFKCIGDLIQGGNWIILGDFNQEAPKIEGHVAHLGLQARLALGPTSLPTTCRGGRIDNVLTPGSITRPRVWTECISSDHYPVSADVSFA